MTLEQPFPELDELLAGVGAAGQRVSEIAASEGAAGNISICIGWPVEVRRRFPLAEPFELPQPAPALAGMTVIVSGACATFTLTQPRTWARWRSGRTAAAHSCTPRRAGCSRASAASSTRT